MYKHSGISSKDQEVILHFVFTPKYRHAIFIGDVAARLQSILTSTCTEFNTEVLALAVQPDHVHILVALPRTITMSLLVQLLKGRSSRFLRQEFPHLVIQAPKALWGRDFFVRSVGSRRDVQKYIESQGF